MSTKNRGFTALTGGGTGALDKIDGDTLADLDFAIVNLLGTSYLYSLDDDASGAESSPNIINPDSNPGTKSWLLQGLDIASLIIEDGLITGGAANTIALGSLTTGLIYDETNARLSIGAAENTVVVNTTSIGSKITTHTEGATDLLDIGPHRHSDTAAFGAAIGMTRSRGSEGAETAVQDNDFLARINFYGHDGTDYELAGQIDCEVDGTVGADQMGGAIVLSTTLDGANSVSERLRIHNTGKHTITTTNDTGLEFGSLGTATRGINMESSGLSGSDQWIRLDGSNTWKADGRLNCTSIFTPTFITNLLSQPAGSNSIVRIDVSGTNTGLLLGNPDEIGSITNATSDGTSSIVKTAHGLSLAVGDFVQITDATTSADEGFYTIKALPDGDTITVNRALAGSDADVDITFYKDAILIDSTDGTSGMRIVLHSHQDKPLQWGGDTLFTTTNMSTEDILIGNILGIINVNTAPSGALTNGVLTWADDFAGGDSRLYLMSEAQTNTLALGGVGLNFSGAGTIETNSADLTLQPLTSGDVVANLASGVFRVDSNAADTVGIMTIENTGGAIQVFVSSVSPEGVITGSIGDLCIIDTTSGEIFIKEIGTATNTGWVEVGGGVASFSSLWYHGVELTTTISTVNTFTQITSFENVGLEDAGGNAVGDATTDDITINLAGDYEIEIGSSFKNASGSNKNMMIVPGVTLATPLTITGATNATPIVMTVVAHGLLNGDMVTQSGVGGNIAANGDFFVTNKADDTYELETLANVDVAGNGAYTSGGTVDIKYSGEIVIERVVSGTDLGRGMAEGSMALAVGDIVELYVANETDANNFITSQVTMKVIREE